VTENQNDPDPLELMRLALLRTVIAEMAHIEDPRDVRSPVCPGCGFGPPMVLTSGQAMCDNDPCPVFMWNVQDTREEFWQVAREVQITENPVWRYPDDTGPGEHAGD
jgi:hypothetical protein